MGSKITWTCGECGATHCPWTSHIDPIKARIQQDSPCTLLNIVFFKANSSSRGKLNPFLPPGVHFSIASFPKKDSLATGVAPGTEFWHPPCS